jgi:hypothetical protein
LHAPILEEAPAARTTAVSGLMREALRSSQSGKTQTRQREHRPLPPPFTSSSSRVREQRDQEAVQAVRSSCAAGRGADDPTLPARASMRVRSRNGGNPPEEDFVAHPPDRLRRLSSASTLIPPVQITMSARGKQLPDGFLDLGRPVAAEALARKGSPEFVQLPEGALSTVSFTRPAMISLPVVTRPTPSGRKGRTRTPRFREGLLQGSPVQGQGQDAKAATVEPGATTALAGQCRRTIPGPG